MPIISHALIPKRSTFSLWRTGVNLPLSTVKITSLWGRNEDLKGMDGLRYSRVKVSGSKVSKTQSPCSLRVGLKMEYELDHERRTSTTSFFAISFMCTS